MNSENNFLRLALAGIMVLSLAGLVYAQHDDKAKTEITTATETKEVEGTVSGIGKDYIAVSYAADAETGMEYEILLQFDKKEIKLEHKNKLKEIKIGDTVKVQYEKVVEKNAEGKEQQSHKAKVISFIKAAPTAEILRTEEPLNLKGPK